MTALIQQLAEKHNMTFCSTLPNSTPTFPEVSTSYLVFFYSVVAAGFIAVLSMANRTLQNQKDLEAKDDKINALKASNNALHTARERFRGRIVQLFGETIDFKRILLGLEGMGVPLRVTIDGKTVMVRVDPEAKHPVHQQNSSQRLPPPFEEWDAPLTSAEADVYGNQRVPPGPLRINTAVDRAVNPQDIPPAPSPADPSFSNRRFERNIPNVEYSNSFGERYTMPATRSAPSAGPLQNHQPIFASYPSLPNAPFASPAPNAEVRNVAPEHTLAAQSAAIRRHRPSPFNHPYPAAREVYNDLPPAAYYNTVPNTPRPELEAHGFVPPAETGTERLYRYASVEDEGSDDGDGKHVTQATATVVASEGVNEMNAATGVTEAVDEMSAATGVTEAVDGMGTATSTCMDDYDPEEDDEIDGTVPGEYGDSGDDTLEGNDAGFNDWLDVTEEDWDNAGS